MAKKERNLKSNFKYDGNSTDYDFHIKKKPNLWWLLLLLVPLLLLIPLKKDITVYTKSDGKPEPFVDVSMNYTARYLLWNKKFNVKMLYDTIQQTDSTGCTVFKRMGYSVYSFIFHFKTPVVFSAGGNECYDSIMKFYRFHTTKKVVLDMSPMLTDVRLKVVDKELGFELPGAKVECDYIGKTGKQHASDTTDAAGCVVVKDARVCGEFEAIKVSAEGYADTLLTNKQVLELLGQAGGYVIPLRPLKERFIFYVKNVYSKEPIPDAFAEVTLTLNGKPGTGGQSCTNVDGLGQGFFDDARVLATINIKASKAGYYDSVYVAPNGKPNPIMVKDFVKLDSIDRVVWLQPKPQAVQFRNVDSLSKQPISGVTNKIVVDGIDEKQRTYTSSSNRNGYFDVTAMPGDKITIVSTLDPYYHPKNTVIDKFEKGQDIYMRPVLVDLTFRTMELDDGKITGVLPDCNLVVTVDGNKVSPSNSGSGTFTVAQLRLTSKISIVASKQGYITNDTKIKNTSVVQLWKANQDARDIPLAKLATLTFRTIEQADGSLLPDCDLVVTVDGKRVQPVNSGNGEFTVEDLKPTSTISIVASKQYYKTNDIKVRNRNVGDLFKAPHDQRDIPLGIERVCGNKYKSNKDPGNSNAVQIKYLHIMDKPSGRFKFMFDTFSYPDCFEVWNCKPDEVGVDKNNLLFRWDEKVSDSPSFVWRDYHNGPFITVVAYRSKKYGTDSDFEYQICCPDEDCEWD